MVHLKKQPPPRKRWYASGITISTRSDVIPEMLSRDEDAVKYLTGVLRDAAEIIETKPKGRPHVQKWSEEGRHDLQVYLAYEESHGVVGTYAISHQNGLYLGVVGCNPGIRRREVRKKLLELVNRRFPPVEGYTPDVKYQSHRM